MGKRFEHFTKENIQMANKYVKILLVTMKMQLKSTMEHLQNN